MTVPQDDRLLVRVLGEPCLPSDPSIGGRPLQVLVYLACRETPASTAHLVNAVWEGEMVSHQTVKSAVYAARCVLRSLTNGASQIVTSSRGIDQVRAIHGAVTDLGLLRSRYRESLTLPSSPEAMDLLIAALRLVNGPPFDAPGYDWAYQVGMDMLDAELLIERATTRLVDLALDLGHIDLAREAVAWGLRGVPGNEVLGRRGLWAERRAGNTSGIHAAYRRLLTFLDSLGLDPDPDTTALYKELVRRRRRHPINRVRSSPNPSILAGRRGSWPIPREHPS